MLTFNIPHTITDHFGDYISNNFLVTEASST